MPSRTCFSRLLLASAVSALLLSPNPSSKRETRAAQALRGSCNAVAAASICTEYYDFTPGYVRDLCEMGQRSYTRGGCPQAKLVGKCRLAGNITLYYKTGGRPFTAKSARKHCTEDSEARWEQE